MFNFVDCFGERCFFGVTVFSSSRSDTPSPTIDPRQEFDRDNVSVAISYVDRYVYRKPDVDGDRLLVISSVAIYLAIKLFQPPAKTLPVSWNATRLIRKCQ